MKPRTVLVLLILLGGCTPKTPEPAGKVAPPPIETFFPTAGTAPASPGPAPAPSPPAPAARPFDESILRGREFLLEPSLSPAAPIRDPVVGVLGTRADLADPIRRFAFAVASGTVDSASLVPRWKDYLLAWAQKAKSNGWAAETVRVGLEREAPEGGWMVPIRVLQPQREWSGWVFLVPDGKAVLVSDIQVVESPPREGPLDPDGQEISSPSLR